MLEWTALLETKASQIPALLKLVLAPVLFSTVLLISTGANQARPFARQPQRRLTDPFVAPQQHTTPQKLAGSQETR